MAAHRRELEAAATAEQTLREAQTVLEKVRQDWRTARAAQRAVEQLETRARQAHRLVEERSEQVALDELATLRALRLQPALPVSQETPVSSL